LEQVADHDVEWPLQLGEVVDTHVLQRVVDQGPQRGAAPHPRSASGDSLQQLAKRQPEDCAPTRTGHETVEPNRRLGEWDGGHHRRVERAGTGADADIRLEAHLGQGVKHPDLEGATAATPAEDQNQGTLGGGIDLRPVVASPAAKGHAAWGTAVA
jgi:hypothetical protein